MNPTRSVLQGNLYSKLSQNIASNGTSIIKKLTSRSLTEQSLQIQIHNHKELALHLVWCIKSNDKTSSRCIERTFSSYRSEYMELVNFREELKKNAIEGLYDCVCDYIPEWLKDKVKRCHLNIPTRLYVEEIYDRNILKK